MAVGDIDRTAAAGHGMARAQYMHTSLYADF